MTRPSPPPPLQIFVDEVSCIGCGKCVFHCPNTFALESSMYGRARWGGTCACAPGAWHGTCTWHPVPGTSHAPACLP
jgi:ferredoxin